mmetsp:Transcript_23986/g.42724  ORF Transcript_23986/g.42724 Transcript_23986/m.42724 type:complete len:339 (+) Transcript_23986:134-1150(+)|eukprot:CAMPEP_0205936280 /NCGR_PEP_ID=MMETSP1325-20131115/41184_1 /ASSEMBLY_ACC=CAM_ASM_000708 /TAXON_ID=236786 /ORGANISM="Florenciella sp., Strain RCC1007" /LENGTH=338 /DNA_ID=CAMNT_0053306427 /DNA_START=90 /DNA_END=1106 /DNA_ORIENTATION=+
MRRAVAVAAAVLGMGVADAFSLRYSQTHRAMPSAVRMTATMQNTEAAPASAEATPQTYTLSVTERARTVAQSCTSGTLCTLCQRDEEDGQNAPFGTHVDYVLDSAGCPVMLLSDQSLHTGNVQKSPRATLYTQMPVDPNTGAQIKAAMPRVSLVGKVVPVTDKDEIFALRTAYSVAHTYADRLIESPKFDFWKLEPERIYYVGGFGVQSTWVDRVEFETATADILALESNELVNKLNAEKQQDLRTLCVQFLGVDDTADFESVRVVAIDKLGMDLRVATDYGARTDEYRVGFLCSVFAMEDAKSEIFKIFQEAWEKEQGYEWEDMGPPVMKYAEDILK